MTFKIFPEITLILFRQFGQEVYCLICLRELFSQPPYLVLKHLDLPCFWIIVPNGLVRDVTGLTCVLHRTDILVDVCVTWV